MSGPLSLLPPRPHEDEAVKKIEGWMEDVKAELD